METRKTENKAATESVRDAFNKLFSTHFAYGVMHRIYKNDEKTIRTAIWVAPAYAAWRACGEYVLKNAIRRYSYLKSVPSLETLCQIIERHEGERYTRLAAEIARLNKTYGSWKYSPEQMRHIDEVRAAQHAYLDAHGYPSFAPYDGICPCCHKNIWLKLTVEQAGSDIITSCPHCARSYDD